MTNHVHLLIREGTEGLAAVTKSIGIAYAIHYNKKYQRKGQLFQDRFKSEPVNDMAYFVTLIRYIHQNPIAANLADHAGDYAWSSYIEYAGRRDCSFPVCTLSHVFSRISREDILQLIDEPLSKALRILDFDCNASVRVSDDEVRAFVSSFGEVSNITEVQHLPKEHRNNIIRQLRQFGASIRQLSRMTGISFGVIRKLE